MTTKATGENLTNMSDREGDDLTAIKGVGPARERWIRESLGVSTYYELASLTADEIESRLKTEGKVVSRSEIEKWLAKAQELAAGAKPSPHQVVEPVNVEFGPTPKNRAIEGEWKTFAAFMVEFKALEATGREQEQQITVARIDVAKNGTWLESEKPAVVEGEQLYQWMLDRAREGRQLEPEEELPAEEPEIRNLDPTTGQPVLPPTAPTLAIDITRIGIQDQRMSRTVIIPVELEIYVGGPNRAISNGSFDIFIYAEGLGPVADQTITPTAATLVLVPSGAASGPFTIAQIALTATQYPGCDQYVGTVNIPANRFPATGLGSYKLTASLTKSATQPTGSFLPGHDIQAYTDGPVLAIEA